MLLDGFRLEILVNNVPIPEITEQIDPQKVINAIFRFDFLV